MKAAAEYWMCGAFGSLLGFRCTLPADHPGDHAAVIDGLLVDTWPRAGM